MKIVSLTRVVLALSILAAPSVAQLASPGTPASARHPKLLATAPPEFVLPAPDVRKLMEEDAARAQWPFRYGAVLPAALASDVAGEWSALPSGELVWRLTLVSPGALSLGVLFDQFELPAGGELYLYDPAQATVLGAFTRANRQENGMLAVQPLLGERCVLEYVQPASVLARPVLRVGEVVHDYRGILDRMALDAPAGVDSGGCLIDINCPAGAEYQDIKRSVLFVLMGGGFCSAALLNNTAADGTPYFLTANHCGNMTNVVAVFDYENSGCGPGGASQAKTISGATLLADSTRYDSQLYRLSATPPAAFEPFYAGWERGTAPVGPAISISHPSGFPKKLARDDEAPVDSGTDFRATWEIGRLEGGSSGSPLFSGAKRVLGPACCVSDFSCNSQWAIYGQFGGFWSQKALGQWLDPLALDPQALDGHEPFLGVATEYLGSGLNPRLYKSLSAPTLGTTWTARIDVSSIPGVGPTWILGHAAPDAGTFLFLGELLIDIASPRYFLSTAPSSAGFSTHSNPIPNLPALLNLHVYTQALIFAPGPAGLTNGVELLLR